MKHSFQETNFNCYLSKDIKTCSKVIRQLPITILNSYCFYSDGGNKVSKTVTIVDLSDDDNNEGEDEKPTDDVSGDEFIPTSTTSTGQPLKKSSRVYAKWTDGNFYPGIIGNIHGEKQVTQKLYFF